MIKGSPRKHRNSCSIRQHLYLSSYSRIHHNVLLKYASGFAIQLSASSPCFCACCPPAVNERPPSSPLLRVSIAPPLSLHPSLSLSLSLSHCIHFCAFKKSPRITNPAESELTGVTEDYKRKQKQDGPGDALGSFPPPFLFFFLFKI